MSIELSVKVNSPVDMKALIEEAYFLLKEIHIVEQIELRVRQGDSWLVDDELRNLIIEKSAFEVVVELPKCAKVFLNVFSAGESEWLGEEGGFWVYFEAGEMPYPSVFLMIILTVAYARLTEGEIVDEESVLTGDRSISADDALNKLIIPTQQHFVPYSIQVCQKLGIHFEQ
jgi:hypothetical protein